MFGDLVQSMYCRKMVRLGAQHWMLCYVLPGSLDNGHSLALAVRCQPNGHVELGLTNPLVLVQFADSDLVITEKQ